jgi:hypothetical protein
VIIYGLGGIGKTCLVFNFYNRMKGKYDYIFWIPAESKASVLLKYNQIANTFMLLQGGEKEEEMITKVKNWLNRCGSSKRWLLIFDNAEKIATELKTLMPSRGSGDESRKRLAKCSARMYRDQSRRVENRRSYGTFLQTCLYKSSADGR